MAESTTTSQRDAMQSAIERVGYYPPVVLDAVEGALAGEGVTAYMLHHEPTFDHDEVRRHLTVLVLTPTRLVVAHTDEHPPDDLLPAPYASTSTEAVPLAKIGSVSVTRMVANPASVHGGGGEPGVSEALLSVGWGAVSRLDLEPATCGDPQCDGDHGYTGMIAAEEFSLRISASAEGPDAVAQLLDFSRALSAATARP